MSSHKFKRITPGEGALVVANSLRTGRTVYLSNTNQWSECVTDARIITDDSTAATLLVNAGTSEVACEVVGPYLIATDADGRANHIRELIRQNGPTVLPDSHALYPHSVATKLAG